MDGKKEKTRLLVEHGAHVGLELGRVVTAGGVLYRGCFFGECRQVFFHDVSVDAAGVLYPVSGQPDDEHEEHAACHEENPDETPIHAALPLRSGVYCSSPRAGSPRGGKSAQYRRRYPCAYAREAFPQAGIPVALRRRRI